MFRELRESYNLTRSQLAELTGRTTNYLLKAESLTFPTPPVALLDLYTGEEPRKWAALSEVEWEPMDRDILISQYRDSQRVKREKWLDLMEPVPSHLTFCRQWVYKLLDDEEDIVSPTEYRVSQGLCIPAPAVYRAEKYGHVSQPIKTALADLVDYVTSGRYYAKGYPDSQRTVISMIAVAKKYGVGYDRLSA